MTTLLELKDLHTFFTTKKGIVKAVNGVSYSVDEGRTLGVVGESGSGKSVSAMSILQLLDGNGYIDSGEIWFNGREMTKLSTREIQKVRGNEISVIFQEPMTSLNPLMKVGKQVEESLKVHTDCSGKEAKAKTLEIFREVEIPEPETRYNCYPHQLSGGLRQRVMIAMAAVCRPKLLIADEPTTAMDVTVEAQILKLLERLRDMGTGVLLISHNLGVIARVCDYVYVMYAGQIVEQAETKVIFDRPMHPYTRGLLRSVISLREGAGMLETIPGVVPNLLRLPAGCSFSLRCGLCGERCERDVPRLLETESRHKVRCFLAEMEGM